MNLRLLLAACVAALTVLVGSPLAGPATAAPISSSVSASARVCTHTSSGTCIRGGQFCPRASYNRSGYDSIGRRYVCKGDRVHPHWMIP